MPPCATPQDVMSMVKTMLDLTYPIPSVSVFSGAGFSRSICSVFKDRQIEAHPQQSPRPQPAWAWTPWAHRVEGWQPGLVPLSPVPLAGPVGPLLHHHHGHHSLCHEGPHRW